MHITPQFPLETLMKYLGIYRKLHIPDGSGNLYLNSTPAMKFYFDMNLPAIAEFTATYHVELSVDDGNDNATFVVFDREVLKLTKKDAAALAVDEINGGGGEQLPQCLEELGGKEFVFQIRVTPFNFTQNHRIFTVSGISDHIEPEYFPVSNYV
ncbi:hypothetical protein Bca52824_017641 [Brassica carinata]|uniref:Uncharacterized protein n=1 Tax=Brassica carinata TaxID=52824 RepID=A0A8X7VMZ3_BRACI|nr:hypothetical protein Bca52824_017641 [Brassica carinata]